MKPIRKQDTSIIWSEEDNAFLASCGKFISHGNSRQEALSEKRHQTTRVTITPNTKPQPTHQHQ